MGSSSPVLRLVNKLSIFTSHRQATVTPTRRVVFLLPMGIDRPSGRRYFNIARGLVQLGSGASAGAPSRLSTCTHRQFVVDGVEVWYVGQMHARKTGSIPQSFSPFQLLRVVVRSTLGMIWEFSIHRQPGTIWVNHNRSMAWPHSSRCASGVVNRFSLIAMMMKSPPTVLRQIGSELSLLSGNGCCQDWQWALP